MVLDKGGEAMGGTKRTAAWWVSVCLIVLMCVRPAGGEILFQDDFNDGTYADKWVTYNGNSFAVENGVFAIDSGFGTDDARAVLKSELWNTAWKDYSVDFDFKIGEYDSGQKGHFALLFNVQAIAEGYDRGQYYQFYSWLDAAGLHRMESTTHRQTTGLAGAAYSALGRSDLSLDTWYHGRLVVLRGSIKGYVGYLDGTYLDTPLFTFDTTEISAEYAYNGPIALKAIGGATNRYDNVVVRAVPEPSTLLVFSGLLGMAVMLRWRRPRRETGIKTASA